MIWFRRLHKWIGLAIGLQIALWMISGLMMGLLDHEKVQGIENQSMPVPMPLRNQRVAILEPAAILSRLNPDTAVSAIDLISIRDRTVYRVRSGDGARLFNAEYGNEVIVDEAFATDIARHDYSGNGEISAISAVHAPMVEIRKHTGPAWRVDFDDESNTSIYVSAQDGRILERRNDTWRLFDIFWMLHIMDYQEREDFNNALVIIVGLVAALFAITGVVLLVDSFDKEDIFGLLPGLGRRLAKVTVHGPAGEVVSRVDARAGLRLYDELARSGIVLPSNCGGGGTCGLCEVTLGPRAPTSEADYRLIPETRRDRGARLSCQARVAKDLAVTVSRESLDAKTHSAKVASIRCVTPFIREIVLNVESASFDYRAGSYVHVLIPPHHLALSDIDVPMEVRRAWGHTAPDVHSRADRELRRAYSLATPSRDIPGTLVLNVRIMMPPADARSAPAGAGSGHMWSLKPGSTIEFVGPLGEFHADDSERDMIVIGGGAGMAPLRAIVRDQLIHRSTGRQIHFWYGARTRSDLFYVEELNGLQLEYGNFSWQPVLSAPDRSDDWRGPVGFVHSAVFEGLLGDRDDVAECEFFVCGPPPMLAATRSMLSELGVPEERVLFDDFGI